MSGGEASRGEKALGTAIIVVLFGAVALVSGQAFGATNVLGWSDGAAPTAEVADAPPEPSPSPTEEAVEVAGKLVTRAGAKAPAGDEDEDEPVAADFPDADAVIALLEEADVACDETGPGVFYGEGIDEERCDIGGGTLQITVFTELAARDRWLRGTSVRAPVLMIGGQPYPMIASSNAIVLVIDNVSEPVLQEVRALLGAPPTAT